MILVILICTLIGWLCGSALIGLGVGLAVFALGLWVENPPSYRTNPRKRRRRLPRR